MKIFHVYMMASRKNGPIYIGLTSDIVQRIYEHKKEVYEDFTKRYNIKRLVYLEEYDNFNDAVSREKQLKKWNRAWKIELIEKEILNGMIYTMNYFNALICSAPCSPLAGLVKLKMTNEKAYSC